MEKLEIRHETGQLQCINCNVYLNPIKVYNNIDYSIGGCYDAYLTCNQCHKEYVVTWYCGNLEIVE